MPRWHQDNQSKLTGKDATDGTRGLKWAKITPTEESALLQQQSPGG